MANANAIIIRKAKIYKKPSLHNLLHNVGLITATYWIKNASNIIQNKKFKTEAEANVNWNEWIANSRKIYKEKSKTKRELRSDAVIIEEGLIVIGRDVFTTHKQIIHIVNDFTKKFSKDNNTEVFHVAYHNHEGHIDDNSNEVINRHIHFLFSNVSKDGVMVRRNWKRDYLKKLQDDIYEISKKYIPNIERGQEVEYEEKNINGKIFKVSIKKHIHPRIFRLNKEQEGIKHKIIKEHELAIENKNHEIHCKNIEIKRLHEVIENMKTDAYSDFKFDNNERITYEFLYKSYQKKCTKQKIQLKEQNKQLKKAIKFVEKHKLNNDQNIDIFDFMKNQKYHLDGLEIALDRFFHENCILRSKMKSLDLNINSSVDKQYPYYDEDINSYYSNNTIQN